MFGIDFNIISAIVEKINGARHICVKGGPISYICLNQDELIFTSDQEKFQVLGLPSDKWRSEHFLNEDKTVQDLVAKILEQVGKYEREGWAIISGQKWLADVRAFNLKKQEWMKKLWIDDPQRLEIQIWGDFLRSQENPIFQDLAIFLKCCLEGDGEMADTPEEPYSKELLRSEIEAANKLARFLANHSNELLCEGADWIPQWIQMYETI